MTHLNELRGIRDQILPLAAFALTAHYPNSGIVSMSDYLHRVATVAIDHCDGLEIMGEVMTEPQHKEAVLKFCQYARLIWDMEVAELATQQNAAWATQLRDQHLHGSQKTEAAA